VYGTIAEEIIDRTAEMSCSPNEGRAALFLHETGLRLLFRIVSSVGFSDSGSGI
jgi:hypothetical protein